MTGTLKTIFDNVNAIDRADDRFVLEEDADGLLYETSNAVTRALVCGQMFRGWDNLYSEEWLDALTDQFGSDREIAERYQRAATDQDK